MISKRRFISLCTFITLFTIANKLAECTHYKAGVVEYYYDINAKLDPKEILQNNVKKYVEIVKTFSRTNSNIEDGILVFPECGLTDESNLNIVSVLVPEPNNQQTNFSGSEVIELLSKAAVNYHTWLVVNLIEKEGDKYYNTDVVFNRNGTIAAKYRKYNLFGEPVNKPSKAEVVSFTTDFKVTFGIFTCFDIMYIHPALDLVEKGINHIVFPTAWYSELPFLTAIQFQKGWSWANNVTLLAAGLSYSKVGNTGSGIYGGRTGHDVYYQTTNSNESHIIMVVLDSMNLDYYEKLAILNLEMTAEHRDKDQSNLRESAESKEDGYQNQKFEEVQTQEGQTSNNSILLLKQESLTSYSTSLLTPERCKIPTDNLNPGHVSNCTKNVVKTLCNHDFCCDFNVTTTFSVYVCKDKTCMDAEKYHPTSSSEDDFSLSVYRLAAFNGVRSFDVTTGGAQVCAVVSCRDENLSSCGLTPMPNRPICFRYDSKYNGCILRRFIMHVNISGQFSEKTSLITPNIILQNNNDTSQFGRITNDFQMNNINGYYTLVYNASSEDVIGTVGIWSRVFERDGQPVTGSSSSFSPSMFIALTLILIYPGLKMVRS